MPYSAVPYSAVPYSAVPNTGAPGQHSRPEPRTGARPGSHRQPETRAGRSRGPQPSAPSYGEDAKPSYRDEPRRDDRARDDRARDDRERPRDGRVRDDRERPRDGWARDDRARDDRSREDLYSTGAHTRAHTGPLYPGHAPEGSGQTAFAYPQTPRGDGYEYQPEVPQPNYPGSWGWVPEASTNRPQQHRPMSPRDRFSR
jgi:hypothetical protein